METYVPERSQRQQEMNTDIPNRLQANVCGNSGPIITHFVRIAVTRDHGSPEYHLAPAFGGREAS